MKVFRHGVTTLALTLTLALVGALLAQAGDRPRFTVNAQGVIKDSQTGLEWVVAPDKGTSYDEASNWVKGCKISGGGWRMPTQAELQGLFIRGSGKCNLDPLFTVTGCLIWAESGGSDSGHLFQYQVGVPVKGDRRGSDSGGGGIPRVFGVRSPK